MHPAWNLRIAPQYCLIAMFVTNSWNPHDPRFDWKGLDFEGFNLQNKGQTVSKLSYIWNVSFNIHIHSSTKWDPKFITSGFVNTRPPANLRYRLQTQGTGKKAGKQLTQLLSKRGKGSCLGKSCFVIFHLVAKADELMKLWMNFKGVSFGRHSRSSAKHKSPIQYTVWNKDWPWFTMMQSRRIERKFLTMFLQYLAASLVLDRNLNKSSVSHYIPSSYTTCKQLQNETT